MKKNLFLLAFAFMVVLPFSAMSQEEEKILNFSEEMPDYPGGYSEMMKFLQENLKYPSEAVEKNIQGKVYVGFVVEKDGSITDVRINRGINKLLDDEAMRVVKLMPKWKPGKNKGQPVRVSYSIPVNYVMTPKKDVQKNDSVKKVS